MTKSKIHEPLINFTRTIGSALDHGLRVMSVNYLFLYVLIGLILCKCWYQNRVNYVWGEGALLTLKTLIRSENGVLCKRIPIVRSTGHYYKLKNISSVRRRPAFDRVEFGRSAEKKEDLPGHYGERWWWRPENGAATGNGTLIGLITINIFLFFYHTFVRQTIDNKRLGDINCRRRWR